MVHEKIKTDNRIPWVVLRSLAESHARNVTVLDDVLGPINGPMHHNDAMYAITLELWKVMKSVDTAICLDAATGTDIWRKEYPGTPMGKWGSIVPQCSATPTIVGDRAYFQGSTGFYCLATKDGAEIWKIPTAQNNSSPVVTDGTVYVYHPNMYAAYDAETGKLKWQSKTYGSGWGASMNLWRHAGKTYLLGAGLGCVDAMDGKQVWRPLSVDTPMPVTLGDLLVQTDGCYVRAFKITPEKADLLWQAPGGSDRISSPLLYQDHVYQFFLDGARCVSVTTGKVDWEERSLGVQFASPVAVDGYVIINIDLNGGSTVMFKATPEKFVKVGCFQSHPAGCSSPAVADGKLYLRQRTFVGCYDLTAH